MMDYHRLQTGLEERAAKQYPGTSFSEILVEINYSTHPRIAQVKKLQQSIYGEEIRKMKTNADGISVILRSESDGTVVIGFNKKEYTKAENKAGKSKKIPQEKDWLETITERVNEMASLAVVHAFDRGMIAEAVLLLYAE